MLGRLFIKNFAIIEELCVDFTENLNVLTGETGAGKSIVIDAVALLLGGRAQTDLIRSGTDKAVLEGVFYLPAGHPVYRLLEELGIEDEEQAVVLTREIAKNGKNTSRINGRTLPLGQYRRVGLLIVDIHGQHDHQSLLQSEFHAAILDKFGRQNHLHLVEAVRESYEKWSETKKQLESLQAREQERLQRIDFLTYQVAEIEQARLLVGEDEELQREQVLLGNTEKISSNLRQAYLHIFGGERGISAYDLVSKALTQIMEIKKLDPALEKLYVLLEPSLYIMEEAAAETRNYLEGLEFSPARLEQVEKRLQVIKDLSKKYGPGISDILEFAEKARSELRIWEKSAETAQELEKQLAACWQDYEKNARELTAKRKSLAIMLENSIAQELAELAMPEAKFSVQFTECEPSPHGMERLEFLISPNPGEPLLPVARIASGGELSRIMLALKTITADRDEIGTLIFDEIDAGMGGKAAQKVADKLEKISKSQQVICVTHSPLIAALADCHLFIEKGVIGGRTSTTVVRLTEDERVDELARMLGGEKQTDELRKHAKQILKNKN